MKVEADGLAELWKGGEVVGGGNGKLMVAYFSFLVSLHLATGQISSFHEILWYNLRRSIIVYENCSLHQSTTYFWAAICSI